MLPGFIQEAWVSPDGTFFYVAWSNGGSSYTGSGVEPRGDQRGSRPFVTTPAVRYDSKVRLRRCAHVPSTSRAMGPDDICSGRGDKPSGVSVHAMNADGGVGAEVPQRAALDAGI